jgi:hypothetical protein
MRHTENDYDISQTSRNQQEEQMNDLYDESRDIDIGLYDTTNEKTSNNRPESDAYTVISVTQYIYGLVWFRMFNFNNISVIS